MKNRVKSDSPTAAGLIYSLNAPNQDPAMVMRHPQQTEYLYLFDCGNLERMPVAHLLAVRRLFITHTHIDHFVGFDSLLRAQLFSHQPLDIYGPPGTCAQIGHRLASYSWNLTADSPYCIRAWDLGSCSVVGRDYPCSRQFRGGRIRRYQKSLLHFEEGGQLSWKEVFHGLPCLGYRFQGEPEWTVQKSALADSGLPPGPWLGRLKELAKKNRLSSKQHEQTGFSSQQLADRLLRLSSGRSLAYVTDTLLDPASRLALLSWLTQVDELYCEATYCEADAQKAQLNLHATARQAAQLAREAQVGRLNLVHLSRRYTPQESPHLSEAQSVFPNSRFAPIWNGPDGPS